MTRSAPTDLGECAFGTETCSGGTWGPCIGAIDVVEEQCNGRDDDCDGRVDNGYECSGAATETEVRFCPGIAFPSVEQRRRCSECEWGDWEPTGTESSCDNWFDDCDTNIDEDYVTRVGGRCRTPMYRHARDHGSPPWNRDDIFYSAGTAPSGANFDGTDCEADSDAGSECYLFALAKSAPPSGSRPFIQCRNGNWDAVLPNATSSSTDLRCPSGWTRTSGIVGWGWGNQFTLSWVLLGGGDIVPILALADIFGENVFLTTDPAKIDAARGRGGYADLNRIGNTSSIPVFCGDFGAAEDVCAIGFAFRDFF